MPKTFSNKILDWFDHSGRHDLPWQKRPTAYRVWVSEIMLQQTQVATVIGYFHRFMQSFPTIKALANATSDEVLHHWSGLGYYARGRNLHKTAIIISEQHHGRFPKTVEGLCELPGIGRSTAGAILSLAYNAKAPIMDGNVKRVFGRHWAIDGWPGNAKVAQLMWDEAEKQLPVRSGRYRDYNQALMDMGATLCTRSQPKCDECPIAGSCQAHKLGLETAFPGKKPKRERPTKTCQMLIVKNQQGEILLEKRPPAGIWGGLWCLPECPTSQDPVEWFQQTYGMNIQVKSKLPIYPHDFSHYHLDITPLNALLIESPHTPTQCKQNLSPQHWYQPALKKPPGGIAAPVNALLAQSTSFLGKTASV